MSTFLHAISCLSGQVWSADPIRVWSKLFVNKSSKNGLLNRKTPMTSNFCAKPYEEHASSIESTKNAAKQATRETRLNTWLHRQVAKDSGATKYPFTKTTAQIGTYWQEKCIGTPLHMAVGKSNVFRSHQWCPAPAGHWKEVQNHFKYIQMLNTIVLEGLLRIFKKLPCLVEVTQRLKIPGLWRFDANLAKRKVEANAKSVNASGVAQNEWTQLCFYAFWWWFCTTVGFLLSGWWSLFLTFQSYGLWTFLRMWMWWNISKNIKYDIIILYTWHSHNMP